MSQAPARPRVIVIDDMPMVREGFANLFPSFRVVADFSAVEPLLADPVPADLVILDLYLRSGPPEQQDVGRLQGVNAIRAIRDLGYRICIHTSEYQPLLLAKCVAAGANGVVHKAEELDVATEAFSSVASGDMVITPSLVGIAEVLERKGALGELTPRQRQVLAARARGKPWKSIARELGINQRTAEEHGRRSRGTLPLPSALKTQPRSNAHLAWDPEDFSRTSHAVLHAQELRIRR